MKCLLFSLFLVVGFGCDNAFTPEYTLAWEPPVVRSLTIYGRQTTELALRQWNYDGPFSTISFSEIKDFYVNGNPLYFDDTSENSRTSTTLSFHVDTPGQYRISILPARIPSEDPEAIKKRFVGGTFDKFRSGAVIYDQYISQTGYLNVRFSPSEVGLVSGFYIYMLETPTEKISRTLYFIERCEDLLHEFIGVIRVGECYSEYF